MSKYFLTNKAIQDLSNIWNYTFEIWSENQADKYYSLLLNAFQELAENPTRGRKYDIVTKELLGFKAGEHIVFYKIISKDEIEIIRILHGMMDLKSKL